MEKLFPLGNLDQEGSHNVMSTHWPVVLPWPPHASSSSCNYKLGNGGSDKSSIDQAKASVASKSHSQAEKRRRERINTHLSTLRRLIPGTTKLDKATLLGRVTDHVKELKRKAFEIGRSSSLITMPTEMDEVTVEYYCDHGYSSNGTAPDQKQENGGSFNILRASLCCEDRPQLYSEINQAIHGLRLRTVRADMTTLGGRVKNVLHLSYSGAIVLGHEDHDQEMISAAAACDLTSTDLKRSLKEVLDRIVFSQVSSQNTNLSKRQRTMPSFYSN